METNKAEPAANNLLGKLFAQTYELVSILGTGASSIVYKAKHLKLDQFVAVKVLQFKQDPSSEKDVARFQQEMRTASSLEHRNIVKILAAGVEDGAPYLVMELVDGSTLSQKLQKDGPLTEREFLVIFGQVLAGLQYLHDSKIIHRDLKPQNILLSKGSNTNSTNVAAKLSDFGIAKDLDPKSSSLTATNEVLGSPAYMSPEQCAGKELDFRSDIYSIGCIMYEALSGKAPFNSENILDVMYKHLHDEAAPLNSKCSVSPSLEQLVAKCLEKDKSKRWSSAAELREALNNCQINNKASDRRIPTRLIWISSGVVAALFLLLFFVLLSNAKKEAAKNLNIVPKHTATIEVTLRRFLSAVNLGQIQLAKDLNEELRSRLGNEQTIRRIHYLRARALYFNNIQHDYRLEKETQDIALKIARSIHAGDKEAQTTFILQEKAVCCAKMYEYKEAEDIIKQGEASDEDSSGWQKTRAYIDVMKGNFIQAQKEIEFFYRVRLAKSVDNPPSKRLNDLYSNMEIEAILAECELGQGQITKARQRAKAIERSLYELEKSPSHRIYLGNCEVRLAQFHEALYLNTHSFDDRAEAMRAAERAIRASKNAESEAKLQAQTILALVSFQTHQNEKSLRILDEIEPIQRKYADRQILATQLLKVANIYKKQPTEGERILDEIMKTSAKESSWLVTPLMFSRGLLSLIVLLLDPDTGTDLQRAAYCNEIMRFLPNARESDRKEANSLVNTALKKSISSSRNSRDSNKAKSTKHPKNLKHYTN